MLPKGQMCLSYSLVDRQGQNSFLWRDKVRILPCKDHLSLGIQGGKHSCVQVNEQRVLGSLRCGCHKVSSGLGHPKKTGNAEGTFCFPVSRIAWDDFPKMDKRPLTIVANEHYGCLSAWSSLYLTWTHLTVGVHGDG